MHYRRVITSEAALCFVILFLSLEEVPGRPSSLKTYDKNVPQSQMAWCEETKACIECAESEPPKCLRNGEPLLGGDLCGCCFSCVVIRGLGESCGSQLSIWSDTLETSPVSSSVTILATSWCRDGLVCVNFVCLDFNANVVPVTFPRLRTDEGFVESKNDHIVSDVFGQDMTTPFDSEAGLPVADFYQRTTTPLWEPILVNHDGTNLPKIVSSTPITPIPSSTSPLTESRKQPEPCYAESEETMTISSYPSDDQLGRVATTIVDGRRFQLVYTGDLLSELKVLLNVIDEFRQDTLLDERVVNSLANGFLDSLSLPDDDGLLLDDQESVKVLPSLAITDAQETATSSSLHNLMFSGSREKRELERIEKDVVGFEAPKNIEDILIRSASAHREYVDMARGYDQQTNISNKNAKVMPAEASSQEDESSVRVHITNHPRKMQTFIDLEEKEEDKEIDDEDRRNLQLVNREHAKDTGKLFPLSDERIEASPPIQKPLGPPRMTEQNGMPENTARSKPTDVSQVMNAPWHEALTTFSDRLTLVEVRMGVFERVLEELAKWSNLGVLSMTRDCLVPQNSNIRDDRWSQETDEHLAVASGIDAVRIRENRRKLSDNMPRRDGYHDTRIPDTAKRPGIFGARKIALRGRNGHVNPSFVRTIIDNDSLRHPSVSGHRGPGRPAKLPCGNTGRRGSSWRQSIADAIDNSPVHRTVQRSVLMTNPSSKNSSEFNKRTNVNRTTPQDTQPLLTLQETQIPVSTTLAKKVMILRDLEKPESSPLEDIFPQGWISTVKITSSSATPSLKMFVSDEKKKENEEEWQSYPRMKSGLGKLGLQRNLGRTKRSVKRVEGISPTHDTLVKIRAEFPVATRRTGKLFERETTTKTGLELDINRNMWPGLIIRENDAHGALFMTGISEFRNSSEPMMRQLLLRNSDLLQTTESTPTEISSNSQNAPMVLDPHAVPYSITNYGNSTIRIEEISKTEFEDRPPQASGFSIAEDDFDHIYESVEGEAKDGDFEYDIVYDRVEYVDSSSVETVSDLPPQLQKPETELKPVLVLSNTKIHSTLFPHERNRRAPRSEDDQCEPRRQTKREMPLLLFGSTEKHEPKTIVWPSKWIGYRRDRLLGVGGSGIDGTGLNSRSWATRSPAILTTATPSLPLRTTQSLIMGHRLQNGETNYVIAPKISSLDRRARKNRRKLFWR